MNLDTVPVDTTIAGLPAEAMRVITARSVYRALVGPNAAVPSVLRASEHLYVSTGPARP